MTDPDSFHPRFPWLGGDLQTLRNRFVWRFRPLPGEAQPLRLPLADGTGDALTGTLHRPEGEARGPLIVLLHGLTGDAGSAYMVEAAHHHVSRGHIVLRLNLRGAGSAAETCEGFYSSAHWPDIHAAIAALDPALTARGVFPVGFSLGGNILVNAMARLPEGSPLLGGASVSAPLDPMGAARRLMHWRNRIYERALLKDMKAAHRTLPEARDPAFREQIDAATSILDFDDRVTAPRTGYASAAEYYDGNAGAQVAGAIPVPFLAIHAEDDPWIPPDPYIALADAPPPLHIALTRAGGHVGFHAAGNPVPWHDRAIAAFIDRLHAAPD